MTTPFGGHRQPLVETTQPSNGVACSRTTGFYLNPVPQQQQPPQQQQQIHQQHHQLQQHHQQQAQQQFDDEEMVWHDESQSISSAAIPGASQHFYPSNFPLPPHL
jgi:hypothetical protein